MPFRVLLGLSRLIRLANIGGDIADIARERKLRKILKERGLRKDQISGFEQAWFYMQSDEEGREEIEEKNPHIDWEKERLIYLNLIYLVFNNDEIAPYLVKDKARRREIRKYLNSIVEGELIDMDDYFCSRCGNTLRREERFCSQCGKAV